MSTSDAVPTSTVLLRSGAKATSTATLGGVLDTLGPHALRLVSPAGTELLEATVGEPVVHGLGEPLPEMTGGIILLTGASPGHSGTFDALRAAGAQGCAAVIVKACGQDLSVPAQVADEAGTALLCTPDEMAWRHLDALITAACTATISVGETALDSRPGDLFALANAIAGSLGGAITIEESTGRVLAYSNLRGHEIDEIRRMAILGRQTPARPTNSEEYRAVIRSPGPVFFESSQRDYASRLAVAIRAGSEVLGVIFVLADRPPLVDDAQHILMDAGRVAALHLLRSRGQQDPDRARRAEALRGMLLGTLGVEAAREVLGLPSSAHLVLAAVRPVRSNTAADTGAAQIADLIALHGQYWHPQAASVAAGGQVLLLLPIDDNDQSMGRSTPPPQDRSHQLAGRLRKLGTTLVTAIRRATGVEVVVGFGPVVQVGDVAAAQSLLNQVMATLEDAPGGSASLTSVATLEETRAQVVLGALAADAVVRDDALLLPHVRAIREHDLAQDTAYAQTLLVYLETFGDAAVTARRLNIHINTARYRIRRLSELFGVDLGRGDETLVTWVQLRGLCSHRAGQAEGGGD